MKRMCVIGLAPLAFTSVASADWAPCGGAEDKLWSWAWAGEAGEYVTTIQGSGGPRITDMLDLSGNGHHYFNHTGSNQPAYQVGLSKDGYSTALPLVALDKYADGSQVYGQWMDQLGTMSAQEFYLAFAGMNTRSGGHRELWGSTENDRVRLDQGNDRINITIDGVTHRIGGDGALPKGPLVLEIWRDASGTLHAWVNGKDMSEPNVVSTAKFALRGIGWKQDGTSGWDDYAFEYIACDGLPTGPQRADVRDYLQAKWGIGSSTGGSSRPAPPTDLEAQ